MSEYHKKSFSMFIISIIYSRCVIRFPSTNIKIGFNSLVEEPVPEAALTPTASQSPPRKKPLPPLKINIPHVGLIQKSVANSPCPSPTGTIRYVFSEYLKHF